MKKFVKWFGIVLGSLFLLATITAFLMAFNATRRMNKIYEVVPAAVTIPTDSTTIAMGKSIAIANCIECHGDDLGGTAFFNDPNLASIPAPNITTGKGGKTAEYSTTDWIRGIRHGIKKDGKPAMIMPSKGFQYLSDEDLGALIAYLKITPPVDKSWPAPSFTFLSKILMSAGAFGDVLSAEIIDHDKVKQVTAPAKGATVAYGDYLVKVSACRNCHGVRLNGFKDPNPNAPFSPNITPGGNLGTWTEAQFIQTMRTGITPDQRQLKAEFMPWKAMGKRSDEELSAIFKYLKAQPNLTTTK
jgi:mono/diheme cytochrome c family protein